jgi:hypothetical protein
MADNSFRVKNSLNLEPQSNAPSNPQSGDIYCDISGAIKKWNGSAWLDVSSQPLTTGHILVGQAGVPTDVAVSGDISIDSAGVTAISSGVIVNADVSASAAIAHSKMAALSVSKALVSDGSGVVSASAVSSTTLSYLDATSSVQTQIDGKQATGSYITALTGDVAASGPGSVAGTIQAGAVDNSKVSATAAIAHTKLANIAAGAVLMGNASNVPTATAVSGDVTITSGGVTAIGAGKVTNTMLAGSIAASKLVGSDIATVGTVTTGTWNGTKIDETHGGTNQATYTLGDTLYSSAANTLSKLAGNTSATKKYLAQTGTGTVSAAPAWSQPAFSELSGNISTSQMNSGTSASSSTFWRGDGTWSAPTSTAVRNEVFYDTGNSLGGSTSGETRVLNFSNARATSSGVTYTARTTTTGDKFTINTAGLYTISAGNVDSAAATSLAISVNGTALTTNANAITWAQGGRAHGSSQAANYPAGCSWTGLLAVNDVIRIQTDGGGGSALPGCYISICQVGS